AAIGQHAATAGANAAAAHLAGGAAVAAQAAVAGIAVGVPTALAAQCLSRRAGARARHAALATRAGDAAAAAVAVGGQAVHTRAIAVGETGVARPLASAIAADRGSAGADVTTVATVLGIATDIS